MCKGIDLATLRADDLLMLHWPGPPAGVQHDQSTVVTSESGDIRTSPEVLRQRLTASTDDTRYVVIPPHTIVRNYESTRHVITA